MPTSQTEDLMRDPKAQLGKQEVNEPYCYSSPVMALGVFPVQNSTNNTDLHNWAQN